MLTGLAALTFTGLTARANDNTVVSNLGEAYGGRSTIGYNKISNNTFTWATAFTTWGNAHMLKSVKAKFTNKQGNPTNFKVRLYTNSSGVPGTEIVQLSGDAPDTTAGSPYTYTCSGSSCGLAANTVYHLVFSADGNGNTNSNQAYRWNSTTATDETQTPSNNGWSIGDDASRLRSSDSNWSTVLGVVGQFSVQAKQTTLAATNVTHDAATLTIADHSGAWYYKYTSPADGTCTAVSSGTTTASLSNLVGNTSYTYKAYSDSSCATELTSASTDVALLTQPATPTTPTVTTGVGSGKLTISSSVSGGNRALKKWQYQQKRENDSNYGQWRNISTTSTSLSHTVTTGLTNGTSYTFKVRAVNEAGSGVSGGGTAPHPLPPPQQHPRTRHSPSVTPPPPASS